MRVRLGRIYGSLPAVLITDSAPVDGDGEAVPEEGGEQIFEFRLFESERKAEDQQVEVQKVVLGGDDENTGEGGFVKMRDPRVFVVGKALGKRKAWFETLAVSGEDVLDNAGKRAWGLEVPWRVRAIRVVEQQKRGEVGDVVIHVEEDNRDPKKKRPGKKRRIVLRGRKKARDEMAEKKRAEAASKEDAERDKRTRRNREKKVKRRRKEKAMKTVGSVGAGSVVDVDGDGARSPDVVGN